MPTQVARRQPRKPIEVRRQQVLDVALRLITEHGYGAVTMEADAREDNLAKPVVYNAYPGRAALLSALLEREERRAFRTLAEAIRPSEGDPAAALLAWLRGVADAIAANPTAWRLMLLPADETPDVVRRRVQRGREVALEQARSLTRSLLAQRPALCALDEELTAHALLAACEQAAKLMIADPGRYPPERLVRYAEHLLRVLTLVP
ncbi:MAG: TetR/AcrR family transcriptional regulator [Acidimicrobiia bacterium]